MISTSTHYTSVFFSFTFDDILKNSSTFQRSNAPHPEKSDEGSPSPYFFLTH